MVAARRMEEKGEYLFGESGRRNAPEIPRFPKKAWKRALAEAKIENLRFHDLRHMRGSYLAMNGASTRELMEALGHKTVTMATRYSHLADVHKREVAERLLEVEGLGG